MTRPRARPRDSPVGCAASHVLCARLGSVGLPLRGSPTDRVRARQVRLASFSCVTSLVRMASSRAVCQFMAARRSCSRPFARRSPGHAVLRTEDLAASALFAGGSGARSADVYTRWPLLNRGLFHRPATRWPTARYQRQLSTALGTNGKRSGLTGIRRRRHDPRLNAPTQETIGRPWP